MAARDKFTDEQWWRMVDAGLGLPVPLAEADLTKPFIYDRTFGIFHCSKAHQCAMTLLLAFQHGCEEGIEVADKLQLEYPSETADHWLETTQGAAFRSSVGSSVQAGKSGSLTVIERRFFGQVEYLF